MSLSCSLLLSRSLSWPVTAGMRGESVGIAAAVVVAEVCLLGCLLRHSDVLLDVVLLHPFHPFQALQSLCSRRGYRAHMRRGSRLEIHLASFLLPLRLMLLLRLLALTLLLLLLTLEVLLLKLLLLLLLLLRPTLQGLLRHLLM